MRRKILWITFGTTMAFWFGCAGSGGDQNYKVLDEDRPMLQPERSTGGPGMSQAPPPSAPALAEPSATTTVQVPAVIATLEPSLNGLDRSAWPTVTVQPERGQVSHYPVYFANRYATGERRLIERVDDPDAQLEAALSGAKAGNLDIANLTNAGLDPLVFARDLILLPYHAVLTPPWSTVMTP